MKIIAYFFAAFAVLFALLSESPTVLAQKSVNVLDRDTNRIKEYCEKKSNLNRCTECAKSSGLNSWMLTNGRFGYKPDPLVIDFQNYFFNSCFKNNQLQNMAMSGDEVTIIEGPLPDQEVVNYCKRKENPRKCNACIKKAGYGTSMLSNEKSGYKMDRMMIQFQTHYFDNCYQK